MCSITGGFYLDGTYLVGLGYRKIHLVIVFSAFCGKRVIVQLMSGSFQHLVDGILIDMSQISAQLVTEERMINRVVGELLIPKCKSDEQPGVGSEHLIFVGIMMQCHPALVPANLQIRRNGASHSLLSRLPGSWILEPGAWSRHAQADEITWEQYVPDNRPHRPPQGRFRRTYRFQVFVVRRCGLRFAQIMRISISAGTGSSAIHLRGPNGIRACKGPIRVEGGHFFLPPSTFTGPLCICTAFCPRRWIAEPK